MDVDTSGADFDHGDAAASGELKVSYEGQTTELEENADLDHDGTLDSAIVSDGNGHYVAFTDADDDGTADHVEVFDSVGHQLGAAQLSADGQLTPEHATGSSASAGGGPGTAGAGSGHLQVTVNGEHTQMQENADLDHDGTLDSAVAQDGNGDYVAFTDTNDDGTADHVEVFDESGNLLGGGQLTPDGHVIPDPNGGPSAPGTGSNGSGADEQSVAYAVDPATGAWVVQA